jgi:hypothetical protein
MRLTQHHHGYRGLHCLPCFVQMRLPQAMREQIIERLSVDQLESLRDRVFQGTDRKRGCVDLVSEKWNGVLAERDLSFLNIYASTVWRVRVPTITRLTVWPGHVVINPKARHFRFPGGIELPNIYRLTADTMAQTEVRPIFFRRFGMGSLLTLSANIQHIIRRHLSLLDGVGNSYARRSHRHSHYSMQRPSYPN